MNTVSIQRTPAGLYVHVPFCVRKCPYCDFYSTTALSLRQNYIRSLCKEMAMAPKSGLVFDTLYIGGGTPSLLGERNVARIIYEASAHFSLSQDPEITIEVNPGTATLGLLAGFCRAGVNRLLVGVQSFRNAALNFLGRIHSGSDAEKTIEQARTAGFEEIGIDLIFGIPGQTRVDWIEDLRRAVGFEPEHISCYSLTYEAGTPMGKALQQGLIRPLKDRDVAEMFAAAQDFLGDHGYAQYEISNYARCPGKSFADHRSRHNRKYWSFAPYIGLGPSAHSCIEPVRYWNISDVSLYMEALDAGRRPIGGEEILRKKDLMIEALYLGLRQADGIDVPWFEHKFGIRFHERFMRTLDCFKNSGHLDVSSERCRLTGKGMLILDTVASMLIGREMEID